MWAWIYFAHFLGNLGPFASAEIMDKFEDDFIFLDKRKGTSGVQSRRSVIDINC